MTFESSSYGGVFLDEKVINSIVKTTKNTDLQITLQELGDDEFKFYRIYLCFDNCPVSGCFWGRVGKSADNFIIIPLSIYVFGLKFIILGRFGDRLLYRNIKKRIKDNRKGKVSLTTGMTSSEKTMVFRGTSIVTCGIIWLVLSNDVLPILIDWIVY